MSLVVTVPALLEPFNFQPDTSTLLSPLLYNSTNSSLAPFGPRVRNSAINIAGCTVGLGDGVGWGDGEGVGVGVDVGVGVGVTVGEGDGV